MYHQAYAPHQSASVEAPVEAADPADGEVRKLAEQRRRHVQVVADAAAAAVSHSSLDGLAVDCSALSEASPFAGTLRKTHS
jgi:hypothetical protein